MPDKLPFLPDEHHYAIAHVASRAAQLDHQIEYSVDFQMQPHKEAAKHIIRNSDTNRLVGLLRALLRDNFKDQPETIEALMKDINDTRRDRNEILHWLWAKGDDEITVKHGSMRIHREEAVKHRTAQQIYDVAALMLKCVRSLADLDDKYSERLTDAQVRAWRDTRVPQTPQEHSASPETEDRPKGIGLLDLQPPPSPEK